MEGRSDPIDFLKLMAARDETSKACKNYLSHLENEITKFAEKLPLPILNQYIDISKISSNQYEKKHKGKLNLSKMITSAVESLNVAYILGHPQKENNYNLYIPVSNKTSYIDVLEYVDECSPTHHALLYASIFKYHTVLNLMNLLNKNQFDAFIDLLYKKETQEFLNLQRKSTQFNHYDAFIAPSDQTLEGYGATYQPAKFFKPTSKCEKLLKTLQKFANFYASVMAQPEKTNENDLDINHFKMI